MELRLPKILYRGTNLDPFMQEVILKLKNATNLRLNINIAL
jgi:hypothetical protein